jgi:hypothetical protein
MQRNKHLEISLLVDYYYLCKNKIKQLWNL